MVTIKFAKECALNFEETDEAPHMEVISVRVKKKIFITLNEKMNRVCVRLNPVDQDVFCSFDSSVIYKVPNAWGKYGWTLIELKKIRKEMLKDAITCAYCNVAPKKLAAKYLPEL
ncbi:MAG TPA: MmcQ/YjbR family DNA-binding protein [Bacteroidia bacterium]|nr:MmcQ/YjbR family DNA-binding protein [Bacteroidia bacterium]